jgi:hypothetical protein
MADSTLSKPRPPKPVCESYIPEWTEEELLGYEECRDSDERAELLRQIELMDDAGCLVVYNKFVEVLRLLEGSLEVTAATEEQPKVRELITMVEVHKSKSKSVELPMVVELTTAVEVPEVVELTTGVELQSLGDVLGALGHGVAQASHWGRRGGQGYVCCQEGEVVSQVSPPG